MTTDRQAEHDTDRADALARIRVVLVRPLYGGNVGAICRAMGNMGARELVIANPRPLDEGEARMMACHARPILEARRSTPDLASAIADCGMVIGTTARGGLYRQTARTAREWGPDVFRKAAQGTQVAIVMGPEDNGLSNEDLALCTHIIQIPTTDDYASLNLSQATLICLYELFLASEQFEPRDEKSDLAPSELRERMFAMWRDNLLEVGFMTEDKADHMMLGLRRILARGALTYDDVNIMMGIARQTEWALDHPDARPTCPVAQEHTS